MCGIAGLFWKAPGAQPHEAALTRALEAIRHRGPDAGSSYDAPGAWLGHRRLSILDLDARSTQPMRRGRLVITFNGEIYNYRSLRARLEGLGHAFTTTSDTEVLLASFEQFGAECLDLLEGMFAFAIWNEETRRLFLARDRFGEKPLFCFHHDNRFAFASEIPALEALLPPQCLSENPVALGLYFQLSYIPAPLSPYHSTFQLEPAHCAWFDSANWKIDIHRYWELRPLQVTSAYEGEVAALKKDLADSVRARLFSSDVPVATFLSGGIDSSIITTLAARAAATPISAYSIGFPQDPEFDETAFARSVAAGLPEIRHKIVAASERGLIAFVQSTLQKLGEPFADASLIPTAFLCANVEEKVILGGDGADEMYAGYGAYRALTLSARLPHAARIAMHGLLGSFGNPHAIRQRVLRGLVLLCRHLQGDATDQYFSWRTYTDSTTMPPFPIDSASMTSLKEHYSYLKNGRLRDFQRADFELNLPCDMLKKVDYASMFHSLEVRLPYLDRNLVAKALGLPDAYKMRGLERKRILRKAFEDQLPRSVLKRPKRGFLLPLRSWFRQGLLRDQLVDMAGTEQGVDRAALHVLLSQHQRGDADHSVLLWATFVYLQWRSSAAARRLAH